MTSPPRSAALADEGSPSGGGRGWLRRRTTLRPDLRAAIALEEAGELLEAARVFEYAGEHAQAALLRLEIARTLRERGERLDVLREGCARCHGGTAEGRLLHLALAEALLAEADVASDAAGMRALQLEAARALEEADEGARAGELFEQLGLLTRAAAAYERGGEIARLELVLAVLERKEQHHTELRALEDQVDRAMAEGNRAHAHALLVEHARAREHAGLAPAPGILARLTRLERALARGSRIDLRWGADRLVALRGDPVFRIGRAPDAHLALPIASLSRHHVELRLDPSGEHTQVVAIDLGTRIGTFVDGEPLVAGEPVTLPGPTELGLGPATTVRVVPIVGKEGAAVGAIVAAAGEIRQHVWLPGGGPLWLTPDIVVPARLLFEDQAVVLDLAAGVHARLHDHPLAPGASIELMLGDRVSLRDAPLVLEVIG